MKTKTTAFMTASQLINLEIEMNEKAIKELEKAYQILKKHNLEATRVLLKQSNLYYRNENLKNLLK